MLWKLKGRKSLIIWQLAFILLGTSWLWAPHLNHHLSYRTALISQYETVGQPYSLFFRFLDILASLLLIFAAFRISKIQNNKIVPWLLTVVGVGLLLDPLFTTTCHNIGNKCEEYFSVGYVLHAAETVITSLTIFALSCYDAWLRKKLVSFSFVLFQLGYTLLFVSQLANHDHFNTVSQYVYQTVIIVWLAWFCRDFIKESNFILRPGELKPVRIVVSGWAFLNGILAILISLAHIHLLGKIKGLYFAGDSAWLAQHGVIIGVVMLYLSRHLARGELRARQIFLAISGIEVIKYSVVSPDPVLMLLYLITFCGLFVLRDDFDRGVVPIKWNVRLKDAYFMLSGLLIATLAALLILDRDSKASVITVRTINNFYDYVAGSNSVSRSHLGSALLAHTLSVFIFVSLITILWILFRPYRLPKSSVRDYARVQELLQRLSNSSEDYFKLWPRDKDYFWQSNKNGFVAYKIVSPTVFALADPISMQKSKLLNEFINWGRAHRLTVCFLPVYSQSLKLYQKAGLETLQIGSSALVDIDSFLTSTANDKWWRWQKNRAEKNGYVYYKASPPHSKDFIKKLKAVSDAWLTIEGRSEQGFALGHFNTGYLQQCDTHYLKDSQGKIVAFTNQLPQFTPANVATVDMLRHLPEVNNAMPYLFYKTIGDLSENSPQIKTFDLGFVPFAKASGPVISIAKALSVNRFSAKGLEQFKNKFDPVWQPNYLAYDGDIGDLAQVALNLEQALER